MKIFGLVSGKRCAQLAALVLATSCGDPETSRLSSRDYPDRQERLERIGMELRQRTPYTDAEFEFFNVNGFHGQRMSVPPGASSSDYHFLLRVESSLVDVWTDSMTRVPISEVDTSWLAPLRASRPANWQSRSVPEAYGGGDVTVIVYRPEGFVYKKITNL